MIDIIYGLDELVAEWVSQQLPGRPELKPCVAIGFAIEDRIIAGAVFNNYRGGSIEWSMAATDKRWMTRRTLRAIFAYPFVQVSVRRLQVTVAKRDKRTRKMVQRLGFKFEGIGRKAMSDGSDAAVYSLLRHEAQKWLPDVPTQDASLCSSPAYDLSQTLVRSDAMI